MSEIRHRFPSYGTVGLIVLLLMQVALVVGHTDELPEVPWHWFTAWATPVCWWGYLLALDAWLHRRTGTGWLATRRGDFAVLCGVSVAWWSLFEVYNRLIPGWQYVNLFDHPGLRFGGYALAFATVLPAIFLTARWLQTGRAFVTVTGSAVRWSPGGLRVAQIVGAVFCLAPFVAPPVVREHLWGAVWVGFVLWLEPINYRRGTQSLFRDWEQGNYARTVQLALAGLICGMLWEFWNHWAHIKWVYLFAVPVGENLRYFEMPVVGLLGFIPFAWECFAAYHFLTGCFTPEDKLEL